eukprot:245844-Prorocentrum_minimum.AAC.1
MGAVAVVNGRIVVTRLETEVPAPEGPVEYQRVEEGEHRKLNSHTYANRGPNERWSQADTEKYYKGGGEAFGVAVWPRGNTNKNQNKTKNNENRFLVRSYVFNICAIVRIRFALLTRKPPLSRTLAPGSVPKASGNTEESVGFAPLEGPARVRTLPPEAVVSPTYSVSLSVMLGTWIFVSQAMSQFGLDFTLIGYMFPERNRRQVR